MMKLHKLIASVFGIGYIGKGGGTIAAAVYCLFWLLMPAEYHSNFREIFLTAVVTVFGIWSGNAVDAVWGKDSNKVVIDEVAGIMITLLFIPVTSKFVLAGLILFRFFDIVKPLFIKRVELLPRGWGVMADDILAGIYAHILLQVIVVYNIL